MILSYQLKIKYAGVVKLADTQDFGCVTTVHLLLWVTGENNIIKSA